MRFGKYELVSRLGRGGMGETYLADSSSSGVTKRLVIKKMRPELALDESMVAAFIEEARVSSSLSHGNIAQVFDFGQTDGEYFLAMEYVPGYSLDNILKTQHAESRGPLPFPVSAYIVIELMKALHYVHTRMTAEGRPLNLIHRDVSPDNLLVSFEGEVKLVDFGIAKTDLPNRLQTDAGVVKGKARYFSPEQASGQTLDARTDIFSAGVVLYQLLTGALPFDGADREAMLKIVNGNFVPVLQRAHLLPDALADVTTRALETARDQRFASALAMQEALARWLFSQSHEMSAEVVRELMGELFPQDPAHGRAGFTSHARATRLLRAMQQTEPQATSRPSQPKEPDRTTTTSTRGTPRAAVALAGLAAICLIGLVTVRIFDGGDAPTPDLRRAPDPARLATPRAKASRPPLPPQTLEMDVGEALDFEGRDIRLTSVGLSRPDVAAGLAQNPGVVRITAHRAGISMFAVTGVDGHVAVTTVHVVDGDRGKRSGAAIAPAAAAK